MASTYKSLTGTRDVPITISDDDDDDDGDFKQYTTVLKESPALNLENNVPKPILSPVAPASVSQTFKDTASFAQPTTLLVERMYDRTSESYSRNSSVTRHNTEEGHNLPVNARDVPIREPSDTLRLPTQMRSIRYIDWDNHLAILILKHIPLPPDPTLIFAFFERNGIPPSKYAYSLYCIHFNLMVTMSSVFPGFYFTPAEELLSRMVACLQCSLLLHK